MKETFEPLKKHQWRPLLEDYKPVASDLSEFKTKVGGEMITGFTKHRPNGKMRVFEDTNGDGRFNKGDQLIAKGRVEKDFRKVVNPLDAFETGQVKETLKRIQTEWDQAGFGTRPTLEFTNADGVLVGRIDFVQTFPVWECCPGCF